MNETSDRNPYGEHSDRKPEPRYWIFFKHIYEIIAPRFLPAFGVMFVTAIVLGFSGSPSGAWFCGCISLVFLLLFFLEHIRIHDNFTLSIKKRFYLGFTMAIIFSFVFGIQKLFQEQDMIVKKSIEPKTQSKEPVYAISRIDSTNHSVPTDSIKVKPRKKTKLQIKAEQVKHDTIINAPNSVISINQQGGITAHTVNIDGLPDRTLPEDKLASAKQKLSKLKVKGMVIGNQFSDEEIENLAKQIESLFKSSGWSIHRESAYIYIPPDGVTLTGISMCFKSDRAKEISELVRDIFRNDLGINIRIIQSNDAQNELLFYVGSKETHK